MNFKVCLCVSLYMNDVLPTFFTGLMISFKESGEHQLTFLVVLYQFPVDSKQEIVFPDSRGPEKVTVEMLDEGDELLAVVLVFVEDACGVVDEHACVVHAQIFSLDIWGSHQVYLIG